MNDQRSLAEQLVTLHALANSNGLYDAADWLERQIEENNRLMRRMTDAHLARLTS